MCTNHVSVHKSTYNMLICVNKILDLILARKASVIHPTRRRTCHKHKITLVAPLGAHSTCALAMATSNADSPPHLPQGILPCVKLKCRSICLSLFPHETANCPPMSILFSPLGIEPPES